MCMSSTRAAAGDGRGLAAVAAALETAGQVAGVDAGSHWCEGLGPSALLRSFSLEDRPMRVRVLVLQMRGNVRSQASAVFAS
jgi:hypothetical protein